MNQVVMKLQCNLLYIENSKKRKRKHKVILSDDDETNVGHSGKSSTQRKRVDQMHVWLAIYEEIPNISENDKRVLRLETMNGLIIGVFSALEVAKSACIDYIIHDLKQENQDFDSIDWEENGWYSDDLIEELDPIQQVYVLKQSIK